MSLFKSLVFMNIVGVTECFFSRPLGSLKAIPFVFNSLTFSNLARNGRKCPRFINIVGSQRRGLSVSAAALRRNALSVYHYGKYVKTNNVYLQGTIPGPRPSVQDSVSRPGFEPGLTCGIGARLGGWKVESGFTQRTRSRSAFESPQPRGTECIEGVSKTSPCSLCPASVASV